MCAQPALLDNLNAELPRLDVSLLNDLLIAILLVLYPEALLLDSHDANSILAFMITVLDGERCPITHLQLAFLHVLRWFRRRASCGFLLLHCKQSLVLLFYLLLCQPHFVHFTERVFQRSKLRQTFPSLACIFGTVTPAYALRLPHGVGLVPYLVEKISHLTSHVRDVQENGGGSIAAFAAFGHICWQKGLPDLGAQNVGLLKHFPGNGLGWQLDLHVQ
mmetsp:Transcript_55285/g.129710  ORF Transcript_55285/g.129710 Transcript_55285/m.129710 type:complete len:219 (-) Transcript_55285:215-871(-)